MAHRLSDAAAPSPDCITMRDESTRAATPFRFRLGRVTATSPALIVQPSFEPRGQELVVQADVSPPPVGSYVWLEEPTDGRVARRLSETLCLPGTALEGVISIAVSNGLDPAFPAAVDDEVARILTAPGLDETGLEDLTALPFVTVDGAHTRDLDQALFVERAAEGFHVWYALADASYYVRPGMALFAEALRRGASYYLPGYVVPMLPRALSEGLISLNAGVERRAMVFRMQLNAAGQCVDTQLLRGRVRSRAKLTFDEVQAFYDDPAGSLLREQPYADSLEVLRDVGRLRVQDAAQRDVVRYRRLEVEVGLDASDRMGFVVVDDLRGEVELYNEQLSLLCNVEGARYLNGGGALDMVQPIYRVHPRPLPERLGEFEQLLQAIARRHGLDASVWGWQRGSDCSLARYLASLPVEGEQGRVARAIHRQAVLLNLRSSFSDQAGAHYGIGADLYARFSSPMREIVGVFVHKEAWEKATGRVLPPALWQTSDAALPDDFALRESVVARANEAKETQKRIDKEANRLVLDRLFSLEMQLDGARRRSRGGTVMGLTRSKAHVLLDAPHLEVKLYARDVALQLGTRIDLAEDGAAWVADDGAVVLRIGDAIRIRVQGYDNEHDRWVFGSS